MLAGIVAFAANLCVYAVLARILSGGNRFVLFLLCGSLFGVALIAHELHGASTVTIQSLSAVLLYACLCELFIVLMAFSLSSISASIVLRLHSTPMTRPQFDLQYSSEAIVSTRVDRILSAGYVRLEGDDLVLTDAGRRIVRVFLAVQRFFGHA